MLKKLSQLIQLSCFRLRFCVRPSDVMGQLRQNAGVNKTKTDKISSLPINMPKISIHLAAVGKPSKAPASGYLYANNIFHGDSGKDIVPISNTFAILGAKLVNEHMQVSAPSGTGRACAIFQCCSCVVSSTEFGAKSQDCSSTLFVSLGYRKMKGSLTPFVPQCSIYAFCSEKGTYDGQGNQIVCRYRPWGVR